MTNPPKHLSENAIVWVIWPMLLSTLFEETTRQGTIIYFGSYNFTIIEASMILPLVALASRAARRSISFTPLMLLVTTIFVILLFDLLRGILVMPAQAFASLRHTGSLVILLALALYLPAEEAFVDDARKAISTAAVYLCVVELLRMIFGVTLFMSSSVVSTQVVDPRLLANDGALIVAGAAVMELSYLLRSPAPRKNRLLQQVRLACFVIGFLISLRATVIVAGVVGLAGVLAFERGPSRASRQLLLMGVAVLVVIVVGGLSEGILGPFGDIGKYLEARDTTSQFRETLWTALIADFNTWPILSQLFGLPAGAKPSLIVFNWGGVDWQYSVHSAYFAALEFYGVIGLLAYIILLLLTTYQNYRRLLTEKGRIKSISAAVGLMLGIVVIVNGYSYEFTGGTSVFLLIALLAARQRRKVRRENIGIQVAVNLRPMKSRMARRIGRHPPNPAAL